MPAADAAEDNQPKGERSKGCDNKDFLLPELSCQWKRVYEVAVRQKGHDCWNNSIFKL